MIQEFFCIFIPGLEWTGLDLSQRGATTECIQPDRNFFTDPTKLVLVINIEIHGIIYQYFTQLCYASTTFPFFFYLSLYHTKYLSLTLHISYTHSLSLSIFSFSYTYTCSFLSFYLFILIYSHLLISLFLCT